MRIFSPAFLSVLSEDSFLAEVEEKFSGKCHKIQVYNAKVIKLIRRPGWRHGHPQKWIDKQESSIKYLN